jgi:hypothetical protein
MLPLHKTWGCAGILNSSLISCMLTTELVGSHDKGTWMCACHLNGFTSGATAAVEKVPALGLDAVCRRPHGRLLSCYTHTTCLLFCCCFCPDARHRQHKTESDSASEQYLKWGVAQGTEREEWGTTHLTHPPGRGLPASQAENRCRQGVVLLGQHPGRHPQPPARAQSWDPGCRFRASVHKPKSTTPGRFHYDIGRPE